MLWEQSGSEKTARFQNMTVANKSVERMAAGGFRSRIRASWAAAIAHFWR
jgi:hypothetical protein